VPLRGIAIGEFVPLLVSEMFPDALPTPAGAKATLKFVLCPGVRVRGRGRPVVEKPVPVTVA